MITFPLAQLAHLCRLCEPVLQQCLGPVAVVVECLVEGVHLVDRILLELFRVLIGIRAWQIEQLVQCIDQGTPL